MIAKHPKAMEEKDVIKLIQLKRYEQPEEGFHDQFLEDFKSRQREELLKRSARGILWERVVTSVREWRLKEWGMVAGGACAAAFAVVVAMQSNTPDPAGGVVAVVPTEAPAEPLVTYVDLDDTQNDELMLVRQPVEAEPALVEF